VGALRLRLICTKNENAFAAESPERYPIQIAHPEKPGKTRHQPNVVLDFDFWELIPKRAALEG